MLCSLRNVYGWANATELRILKVAVDLFLAAGYCNVVIASCEIALDLIHLFRYLGHLTLIRNKMNTAVANI